MPSRGKQQIRAVISYIRQWSIGQAASWWAALFFPAELFYLFPEKLKLKNLLGIPRSWPIVVIGAPLNIQRQLKDRCLCHCWPYKTMPPPRLVYPDNCSRPDYLP